MTLHSITTSTPVGDFHMILEGDTVRASGFGTLVELQKRLPVTLQSVEITQAPAGHPYEALVQAYFAGDHDALAKIPSAQEGTAFSQQIWKAMSGVRYGQTISYAELAAAAGAPKAIRVAGTVCGENRLILLVPCHRIIRSDGEVGQYLYGSEIKKFLLDMEKGVTPSSAV